MHDVNVRSERTHACAYAYEEHTCAATFGARTIALTRDETGQMRGVHPELANLFDLRDGSRRAEEAKD
jgi:hypothetical protein